MTKTTRIASTARATLPARTIPQASAGTGAWWRLGVGAATLGAEGTTGYMYPALGAVLAIIDVAVPLAVGAVLLAAILFGSNETCERVFRLLRWIANRPEPPAPGQDNPDAAMTGYGHHVGFRG